MASAANFDRIARPYRWLEYLTLGGALHRCRLTHLTALLQQRRALVLGDGDGRFLAQLLAANPVVTVTAIDSSAAMLRLLQQRCRTNERRLKTLQIDATAPTVEEALQRGPIDLVVTHFFLDCLSAEELEQLVARIAPHLTADAAWVVSDFRIPGGVMRLPAQALVGALYAIFGVLTGLRTRALPDHPAMLEACGMRLVARQYSLGGMLTSELWQRQPASNPAMSTLSTEPQDVDHGDPIPDPEPISPSLPEPDPGVYRPATPNSGE